MENRSVPGTTIKDAVIAIIINDEVTPLWKTTSKDDTEGHILAAKIVAVGYQAIHYSNCTMFEQWIMANINVQVAITNISILYDRDFNELVNIDGLYQDFLQKQYKIAHDQ